MNKALLIGNITKDIELKQTPNGKNVISTSIATNENFTSNGEKQQETTFHNIVAWGKTAELMANYLGKGSKVLVEGKIQNRSYEKDGTTKYITEINVFNIEFLSKAPDKNTQPTVQPVEQKNGVQKQQDIQDEISIEDIPF